MRLIICFDDILIMRRSVEEILMSRETEIFLLQHLGFVINLQRYIMGPNKKMEFWGVKINFGGHENVPPKGENNGNTRSVQETPITEKYNPEGISKSNWKFYFDISSSPPGSSTLLLVTNVPDNKVKGHPLLRR